MASAINASTTDGLQIISDASGDFEFQRNGVKIAGFTSTGVENSGLENSTISINGTSTALGGTADLSQGGMHLHAATTANDFITYTSNAVMTQWYAIPYNSDITYSGNGIVTVNRDGLYQIVVTLLVHIGIKDGVDASNGADGRVEIGVNGVYDRKTAFYSSAYNSVDWEKSTSTLVVPLESGNTIRLVSIGTNHVWASTNSANNTKHSNWVITRVGD
jgi:hypothetical protein